MTRRDVCDGRGTVTRRDTCSNEGTARGHVQWERHEVAAWSMGAEVRGTAFEVGRARLELGTDREVVLSDREPHEVSKLNSVWKRIHTFTFSA